VIVEPTAGDRLADNPDPKGRLCHAAPGPAAIPLCGKSNQPFPHIGADRPVCDAPRPLRDGSAQGSNGKQVAPKIFFIGRDGPWA